jgi:hypothetical protein
MSRTFYPSDEYDSQELERAFKGRMRKWLARRRRSDDDDDDPPMSPVTGRRPIPFPPLVDAAAQAA